VSRDHDKSLDDRTKNGAGAPARAGIAVEKTVGYGNK
jgi:hypothetical protein